MAELPLIEGIGDAGNLSRNLPAHIVAAIRREAQLGRLKGKRNPFESAIILRLITPTTPNIGEGDRWDKQLGESLEVGLLSMVAAANDENHHPWGEDLRRSLAEAVLEFISADDPAANDEIFELALEQIAS